MTDHPPDGEAGLIQEYFAPLADDTEGAFGLVDDAGRIVAPEGHEVVLTTDMIVGGVHYLESASPHDVGYKALAVNISDLCAKGAEPAVYLLSIALPENPDAKWLESLSSGFARAQEEFDCGLLGGDTVHSPGPVVISVTAAGFVPEGRMVHRFTAGEGDILYVTGTIGDAALGLLLLDGKRQDARDILTADQTDFLESRYWRPAPRLDAIPIVRKYTSSCMDISDGLAGDFAKMCTSSDVGGTIESARVPLSNAAVTLLDAEPEHLEAVLTGGDDYELLMTVPEDRTAAFEQEFSASGVEITRIGYISAADDGVKVLSGDGTAMRLEHPSYSHF